MKRLQSIVNKLYPAALLFLLLLCWQALVQWKQIPSYILPAPYQILETMLEDLPFIVKHSYVTLLEALIGLFISIVLAFGLAVIIDQFEQIKKTIYPLLVISQTIPMIAIAPLFIIWFGFGMIPKIVVVVMVCFFPIAINLADGFDRVDRDYINLFKTLKATNVKTFFHLKLPFASPYFFSGLKIATTYMFMAAVIGEWLGGVEGIGVYMVRAKSAYALDKVFASIFVIVILSMAMMYLIQHLERKIIHWK